MYGEQLLAAPHLTEFAVLQYHTDDNIAAIASAPGGACRGIVRLAGPTALACLSRVFTPAAGDAADRWAALTPDSPPVVIDGTLAQEPGHELPVRAYIWPGIRSYTRSPLVELHTIGSPPLLEWVVERLGTAGARAALPGEFTLRAFLAGRLDLTQAEAVLGVIDAQGQVSLNTALAQLAGGLAGPLAELRTRLLDLLAHLEAGLDFVEEDIEFISADELQSQLGDIRHQVEAIAAQMQSRGESREMPRVVLTGLPNVGKSSLFNALLQGDANEPTRDANATDGTNAGSARRIRAAIVSDIAGTTRDFLVGETTVGNRRCLVVDTAGVEHLDGSPATSDELAPAVNQAAEVAAQALGDTQRAAAAVTLLCLDASRPLTPWEAEQLATPCRARVTVLTKADRVTPGAPLPANGIVTSSVSGQGLAELRQAIEAALAAAGDAEPGETTGAVTATAIRCRESLRQAAQALEAATDLAAGGLGEELVAAEIRLALDALGQVTGAVYTDDILDRIFSRFCIGK